MKKAILLVTTLMLVFAIPQTYADDDIWTMAESEEYGTKAGGMLGRGLINVGTCFMDIVVQTVEKTEQGPPFVGTMTGLGSGLGCTALRVSSGALDIVTSWVPGFNGFPVSKSYSDCTDFGEEEVIETVVATTYVAPLPAPVEEKVKKHDPLDYVKK